METYDPLGIAEQKDSSATYDPLGLVTKDSYDPLGIVEADSTPSLLEKGAGFLRNVSERINEPFNPDPNIAGTLTEFDKLGPFTEPTPEVILDSTPIREAVENTIKATARVGGATAATMALYPGAGVAGIIELINTGNLQKANTVVQEVLSAPQKFIKTPEEARAMELISYAFKPIEMSGEGWRLIGKEIEELTGIKYLEPILGTIGESAAMFTLPEMIRRSRAVPAKVTKGVSAKSLEKFGEAQTAKHPAYGPTTEVGKYGLQEKPIPLTGTELAQRQVKRDAAAEIIPKEIKSFNQYAIERGIYDKVSEAQVREEYKAYTETGKFPEEFTTDSTTGMMFESVKNVAREVILEHKAKAQTKKLMEEKVVEETKAAETKAAKEEVTKEVGEVEVKKPGVDVAAVADELGTEIKLGKEGLKQVEDAIVKVEKKGGSERLNPALLIDGKVRVAELPDGTTHGMLYDLAEGEVKGAKSVKSGWAKPDGSEFTTTPPKGVDAAKALKKKGDAIELEAEKQAAKYLKDKREAAESTKFLTVFRSGPMRKTKGSWAEGYFVTENVATASGYKSMTKEKIQAFKIPSEGIIDITKESKALYKSGKAKNITEAKKIVSEKYPDAKGYAYREGGRSTETEIMIKSADGVKTIDTGKAMRDWEKNDYEAKKKSKGTTLYSGLDPTQLVENLRGLTTNIKAAKPYLEELGRRLYNPKGTFEVWRNQMKSHLGKSWTAFKEYIAETWRIVKKTYKVSKLGDERGLVGPDINKKSWGLKSSVRAGWELVTEKSATARGLDKTARVTAKEAKELVMDPADVTSKDPAAKEGFKLLLNAEESGNAFVFKNLVQFTESTKGIKKGSDSSIKIGKALEGIEKLENLTKQERKAYDFLKENFDFLIHEFARRSSGSKEAYKRVLAAVGAEHPKKAKIFDLDPVRAKEYAAITKEANELRGNRKVSELKGEELREYRDLQQSARDIRNRDFVDTLPEGEREAYMILSRRIDQYLPHLFDQKDLLNVFKLDLEVAKKKLTKTTKKGSETRYKNQIIKLEAAITKLEGGGYVSFRQLPKEVFFRFFQERKGKKGYSFDAIRAYETYLHGLTRKMFDEPALKQITTNLFPKVAPSLKPYMRQLVDHYMGYDKRPMESAANAITTFEWIRTLGFNPRSALVNLTQRINTMAYAGEKWSFQAEKMMLTDRINANALFNETGIAREVPSVLTEGPPSVGMKAVNDVARFMFNQVELGNRKHAFLAGYLKATKAGKAKGLNGDALKTYAKKEGVKTVHETQFRYGKLGMPKMYWNPYARVALQFTSYPLKQARFLYRLWHKDKVAFMKYVVYAEGVNYTLRELLDTDMSNALGFGITWGEALNTVLSLGEGDPRGALRHAKQTITLGGGLLPGGPGPAVGGVLSIVEQAKKGKGLKQLKKELTPIVLTRITQAYEAVQNEKDGKYPIYNAEDDVMYKLTARQLLQRTIGPKTAKERASMIKYFSDTALDKERQEISNEVRDLFIAGDISGAARLVNKYGEAVIPTDAALEAKEAKHYFTREERESFKEPGKNEPYKLMRSKGKI